MADKNQPTQGEVCPYECGGDKDNHNVGCTLHPDNPYLLEPTDEMRALTTELVGDVDDILAVPVQTSDKTVTKQKSPVSSRVTNQDSPTTDVVDSNVTDKKTNKNVGKKQLEHTHQAIRPDKPTHTIRGCAVCNKNFPTGDELIVHMALHLTGGAKGSLPTEPKTDAVTRAVAIADGKSLAPKLEQPKHKHQEDWYGNCYICGISLTLGRQGLERPSSAEIVELEKIWKILPNCGNPKCLSHKDGQFSLRGLCGVCRYAIDSIAQRERLAEERGYIRGLIETPATQSVARATRAAQLRQQGKTIREIVDLMGFKSPGSVSWLLKQISQRGLKNGETHNG